MAFQFPGTPLSGGKRPRKGITKLRKHLGVSKLKQVTKMGMSGGKIRKNFLVAKFKF